jgi:hypothetical protein
MGEFKRIFQIDDDLHNSSGIKNLIKFIQDQISKIKFVYYGQIRIDLVLNIDNKINEEDCFDKNLYTTLVCEALKGPQGIYIEESQIQRLDLNFLRCTGKSRLEILIKGNVDEYVIKPLLMYEMPDGLFYPVSFRVWSRDGIKDITPEQKGIILASLYKITKKKMGSNYIGSYTLDDFKITSYKSPMLKGFSKEQAYKSGFNMNFIYQWKNYKAFKSALLEMA